MLPALLQVGSPGQTYTTITTLVVYSRTQSSVVSVGETTSSGLTTSTYGPSVGTIPASYTSPATGLQICYYVPYHFHVDDSVQRVVGYVSASSPFNFYVMSQGQYDYFIAQNPPCGSSYTAITLGYLENTFKVDLAAGSGDYYILLENVSNSPIKYSVQLFAIMKASSAIYSTTLAIRLVTYTSTLSQLALLTRQSQVTAQASPHPNAAFTIGIVTIAIIAFLAVFIWSKRRRRKEEPTRIY